MTRVSLFITLALALQLSFGFPLSFTVKKDSPLCFIERFDLGEVD